MRSLWLQRRAGRLLPPPSSGLRGGSPLQTLRAQPWVPTAAALCFSLPGNTLRGLGSEEAAEVRAGVLLAPGVSRAFIV